MIRALRLASWSGVDVLILLPNKNDIFFMKWVNRAFYKILLKAGVRVFEYLPSILHSKVVLIDDWVILGSSNRNHRSLIHDLEVDLVLTHASSLLSIISQFRKDLRHSEEITLKKWSARYWIHNRYEKILLSLRNWL
jgi:cardiolipin synthase